MKTKLILILALALSGISVACADETNTLVATNAQSYRRISSAEVGTIRLEVEQIGAGDEVQFRVRDFWEYNHEKKEVFCDLYYISDKGKEEKKPFTRVALRQTSPSLENYSGSITNETEFTHGQKFKVVYKSNSLPLPISTWYACYYH